MTNKTTNFSARWSINGRFLTQQVTGVQRYATQLTQALESVVNVANAPDCLEIVAPRRTPSPEFTKLPFRQAGQHKGQFWEQLSLPRSTAGGILSLCNTGPVLRRKHFVCIHDTNVIDFPQSYSPAFRSYYRLILPLLGRTASLVLTVSKKSADLLMRHGIAKSRKIEVISNGHEHVFGWDAANSTLLKAAPPERPFVFVIGSRAPHKNVALIHRIAPALDKMGLDIYISGGKSAVFSGSDKHLQNGTKSTVTNSTVTNSTGNIRYLGYVSDDDLADLYAKATCLLFPSFVEGFGLPLVEAMAFGCPIISSDSSCMPEICGDHAELVSPRSPEQWVEGVRRILEYPDKTSPATLKKHLEKFSWRRSAEKLFELMDSF